MPQDLPEPLLVRQRTTFTEHQSEQVLQSGRSPKSRSRSHKSSRVFVPISGGVVIVMATLFFLIAVQKEKKTKKEKEKKVEKTKILNNVKKITKSTKKESNI